MLLRRELKSAQKTRTELRCAFSIRRSLGPATSHRSPADCFVLPRTTVFAARASYSVHPSVGSTGLRRLRMTKRSKSLFFPAARQQIRSDEGLQVSIEDTIDIAHFGFRAVVFDHAIGLQHVRANLRSEFNVEFRVFNFLAGCPLFFHLEFVELGTQH